METVRVENIEGYQDEYGNVFLSLENTVQKLYLCKTKTGREFIRWDKFDEDLFNLGISHYEPDWFLPAEIIARLAKKRNPAFGETLRTRVIPGIREKMPVPSITYMFSGEPIVIYKIAEEIWVDAVIMAKMLGYPDPVSAVDKYTKPEDRRNINGKTAINKSGMYDLLSMATKITVPLDWQCGKAPVNKFVEQLRAENLELRQKARYYDIILSSPSLVAISVIAKDYGMTAQEMNLLLHEKGVQYKKAGTWLLYKKYASRGYTGTKTRMFATKANAKTEVRTYWTQEGRKFIYELLKQDGILPLIEANIA